MTAPGRRAGQGGAHRVVLASRRERRHDAARAGRVVLLRSVVVLTVLAGVNYLAWRWLESVNWSAWWIAVPLVVAETYSLVDVLLFGLTMWRAVPRPPAPAADPDVTVDVFVTTYDEPAELVRRTARAARDMHHPHRTYVLDDGARPALRQVAEDLGVGYVVRTQDWVDRPRHAKAGNLNNALFQTDGELIAILDADQVPAPEFLEHTIGWFTDDRVALVQTPQHFTNVTEADPLGSQAPLFYGPIQQGKDGWNAAFFCGSNAVLRREALMQLGLVGYVRETERSVREALRASRSILARGRRRAADPRVAGVLDEVAAAAGEALRALDGGAALATVTFEFQRRVDALSADVVASDLAAMRADLEALGEGPIATDDELRLPVVDEAALARLAERDWSPVGALAAVETLVRAVDVDRGGEALPVMPVATLSVTEDMATAMHLHALGWRTVYHHERLVLGLAPEDLGTMLAQRLRWAQGTMQVMLRENPLRVPGLALGQRLMYLATMWSYLSGFAAVVYIAAPIVFLCFGVLPVTAWSWEFFARFLPFQLASQLLFLVAARGIRTWRGQQYSLALFPVWIRASVTAAANVWFGRPLGFVVTAKERRERTGQGRAVLPQAVAAGLLVVAVVVGLARAAAGLSPWTGTLVNVAWVAYDLVVLSVLVRALRYRGSDRPTEGVAG